MVPTHLLGSPQGQTLQYRQRQDWHACRKLMVRSRVAARVRADNETTVGVKKKLPYCCRSTAVARHAVGEKNSTRTVTARRTVL